MPQEDAFAKFAAAGAPLAENPWRGTRFEPDLARLGRLLAVCAEGANKWRGQEGGAIGLALDLWIADELRRAGYEQDAVWPRAEAPRVLTVSVGRAIRGLPKTLRPPGGSPVVTGPVARRLELDSGRAIAVIQGEFFPKRVDVLVADWDRGVELLVSTKSMVDSYGNNVKNRWEEFVGDLRNIRGRFPLATLGVFFMSDARIVSDEPETFARLQEMLLRLRKRSDSGSAYDATALILGTAKAAKRAELVPGPVPAELQLAQFFESLIAEAFERLPNSERAAARGLYRTASLPTTEVTHIPPSIADPS